MKSSIERLFMLGAAVAILSLTIPAFAQTSGTGVDPVLVSGDASPEQIAQACGITTIQGSFAIQSPASGIHSSGAFSVDLTVTSSTLDFDDISNPDQFIGTPGVEAVGIRRNNTNIYCYPTRISDTNLDPPGTGAPNEVTFVWGPGPCLLEQTDVETACSVYNDPDRTADYLQAHLVEQTQPVNVCGCPPLQALFCDPALPVGAVGSCNPEEGALTALQSISSGTTGTGTCRTVSDTSSGKLRTYLVCN